MALNGFFGQTVTASAIVGDTVEASELQVTGEVAAGGGIRSSSQTAGIGYAAEIPTVTQVGIRTSAVTCNAVIGNIETATDPFASGATVSFQVNCTSCEANDLVICQTVDSDTTPLGVIPTVCVGTSEGAFVLRMSNNSGGPLNGSFTVGFAIIKR